MVYSLFVAAFREHVFTVSSDRFSNNSYTRFIERFHGKHPLLVPELIVLNDQPFGFKPTKKQFKNLEKLPIFCELECVTESNDDEFPIIDSLDLFCEVSLSLKHKVSTLQTLCDVYSQFIYVERIKALGKMGESSLLIYSTLGTLFSERFFDEELDDDVITESLLQQLFNDYIGMFIQFIKVFDEVFFQDKSLDEIDSELLLL